MTTPVSRRGAFSTRLIGPSLSAVAGVEKSAASRVVLCSSDLLIGPPSFPDRTRPDGKCLGSVSIIARSLVVYFDTDANLVKESPTRRRDQAGLETSTTPLLRSSC